MLRILLSQALTKRLAIANWLVMAEANWQLTIGSWQSIAPPSLMVE
jgi:hypothetical protein